MAAFCSAAASDQLSVKITVVVTLGFTERAPRVNALRFRSVAGLAHPPMKPSFFVLVVIPATIPDT